MHRWEESRLASPLRANLAVLRKLGLYVVEALAGADLVFVFDRWDMLEGTTILRRLSKIPTGEAHGTAGRQ